MICVKNDVKPVGNIGLIRMQNKPYIEI